MYTVELDISRESSFDETVEFAAEYNCDAKLLLEEGPAGWGPLYLFTSKNYNDLAELVEEILIYSDPFQLKNMIVKV